MSSNPENVPTSAETPQLTADDLANVERFKESFAKIKSELGKVIVGQEAVVNQLLVSIVSGGHSLLVVQAHYAELGREPTDVELEQNRVVPLDAGKALRSTGNHPERAHDAVTAEHRLPAVERDVSVQCKHSDAAARAFLLCLRQGLLA